MWYKRSALVLGLAALAWLAHGSLTTLAGTGKTVTLFNGKDLAGWKLKGKGEKSKWVVGEATLDVTNAAKLAVKEGAGGQRRRGAFGIIGARLICVRL